ncbi:hypothetical protein U1Q18_040269 [Sarracenia purpurea var. burkii]
MRSMAILEADIPCIPKEAATSFLSAMQLKIGCNRGEVTYIAALTEEEADKNNEALPSKILEVLDEY